MKNYGEGKIVEIARRILDRLDREEYKRPAQELTCEEELLRVCMNDIIDRMSEYNSSL